MNSELLNHFLDRVHFDGNHWLWTAYRTHFGTGYGQMHHRPSMPKAEMAHRVSYEMFVGPIPKGMQIDHLCRIKNCVNPDHLEPVTAQENVRRHHAVVRRTHCRNGHEYTEASTYLHNGVRFCRPCRAIYMRRYNARRNEVAS